MSEVWGRWSAVAREFVRVWTQPHRRAAFIALLKANSLLGTLSAAAWLLNTHFFSRRFAQPPISLAWSMLTVIFFTTCAQVAVSAVLKIRGQRRGLRAAEANRRLAELLAAFIAGESLQEQIEKAAVHSPQYFESQVSAAMLGLRGSALRELRELPDVRALRGKWIRKSRSSDAGERRYAVEQMALLRDPFAIPALEGALQDSEAAVVACAVRGLLQLDSYQRRAELLRSLPDRPYLVRVLTACEATAEPVVPGSPPVIPRVEEFAIEYETPDVARAQCSALAALGSQGRDLLRLMAALGHAGDAPAEALSESLVAMAKGSQA